MTSRRKKRTEHESSNIGDLVREVLSAGSASGDLIDKSEDPSRKKDAIVEIVSSFESRLYQGPIPPPTMLKAYEEVCPGSAKMILENFDRQSKHRQIMERNHQSHTNARSWGGLIAGFAITLCAMGMAAYLAKLGHSDAAVAVTLTAIGSLAGVFVLGKYMSTENLRKKKATIEKGGQPTKTAGSGSTEIAANRD